MRVVVSSTYRAGGQLKKMVSSKLAFFAENPSPGYSLDPPNIYKPSARLFPARLIQAVCVSQRRVFQFEAKEVGATKAVHIFIE